MTDKELLELAAKAAGVCLHPASALHHSYGNWGRDTTCTICGEEPSGATWNPLTDDGDALRLAVTLKLHLYIDDDDIDVVSPENGRCDTETWDEHDSNKMKATRLSIVRAAAEIGRKL